MEGVEADGHMLVAGNWKLHGAICKQLYAAVHEILETIPILEASRPGSSSGIQALCSLRVAVDKAKNILQHCSECSKLYLSVTAYCVLATFEKARSALLESLHQVEETIPESIDSQIPDVVRELQEAVFALDRSEKRAGDEVKQLIQSDKISSNGCLDNDELETFHQAALKVGITSSRAALTERRALKKLLERAHAEEDTTKESTALHLLHLMRKYSKIFRSETTDHASSQGSSSCCSPSFDGSNDLHGDKLRQSKALLRSMPVPPEELRCPISLHIMYDPVVISSGQTYERAYIEKWFNNGNRTCPKTRKQLFHLSMTPNYCVKGLIASWCEENRVPIPSAPPESPKLNRLRLSSLKSSATLATTSVETALSEEIGVSDDVEADNKAGSHQSHEVVSSERCEQWLRVLSAKDVHAADEQQEVVEHIRCLLKDDEELRTYMCANGFTQPLVEFLRRATCRGDQQAQEVGAMALFNLAVNHDRNKKLLLSAGVAPLLEEMIQRSETCEAATALYLNLSCLGEARPVIGASAAVPCLVKCLREGGDGCRSDTCRLDALLALYNLSRHSPNTPFLISAGIVRGLAAMLSPCSAWADEALAILRNLARSPAGKKELVSNPALVGAVVLIMDNGAPAEKEKAVSCLWAVCNGDESSSYTVLQEGVIPAAVSLAANGTPRAKDSAQRLLRLFREQRQRELDQLTPQVQLHEVASQAAAAQQCRHEAATPAAERPRTSRSRKRLGRALSCIWS